MVKNLMFLSILLHLSFCGGKKQEFNLQLNVHGDPGYKERMYVGIYFYKGDEQLDLPIQMEDTSQDKYQVKDILDTEKQNRIKLNEDLRLNVIDFMTKLSDKKLNLKEPSFILSFHPLCKGNFRSSKLLFPSNKYKVWQETSKNQEDNNHKNDEYVDLFTKFSFSSEIDVYERIKDFLLYL